MIEVPVKLVILGNCVVTRGRMMDVGLAHPWIGAAGTSAVSPGSVGADLGQGMLQKTPMACVVLEFGNVDRQSWSRLASL